MKPELVIFHCDGVLVDTEPVANAVMAELLSAEGLSLDAAGATAQFVGKSMRPVKIEVEAELGRALTDDWLEGVWAATLKRFGETAVDPIPGVNDVIAVIDRAEIPIRVASSGSIAKMKTTLSATGLYPRLKDVLFTADDVEHGKPAPDLFLHAARAMPVSPGSCAVIEDSRFGVEAAVSAGMRALGYTAAPHSDPAVFLELCAENFNDMALPPSLLELEVGP
ncbi:MAG: HAD family phosphatase [Pseudomonadota bacterium]